MIWRIRYYWEVGLNGRELDLWFEGWGLIITTPIRLKGSLQKSRCHIRFQTQTDTSNSQSFQRNCVAHPHNTTLVFYGNWQNIWPHWRWASKRLNNSISLHFTCLHPTSKIKAKSTTTPSTAQNKQQHIFLFNFFQNVHRLNASQHLMTFGSVCLWRPMDCRGEPWLWDLTRDRASQISSGPGWLDETGVVGPSAQVCFQKDSTAWGLGDEAAHGSMFFLKGKKEGRKKTWFI